MTLPWGCDGGDDVPAIAKIEASARPSEGGVYKKHEVKLFSRFWNWLFPRLERGADLGEAYGEAEVAIRDAAARKTTEEAAEIAAKREIAEADAGAKRQAEVASFIANVEAIENLKSNAGKGMAIAKLFEQNPQIMEQLELVEDLVSQLNLKHGLMITRVNNEAEVEAGEGTD